VSEQFDDRELWRRFAASSVTAAEPSVLDLAAYADGTLDAGAADAVEAWLALNPDDWDGVLEARLLRDIEPEELPVPFAAVRRARALVLAAIAVNPWQRRAGWVAVAASLVLICLAEFPAPVKHASAPASHSEPILIDLGVNVGVGAGDAGSLL